MQKLDEAVVAKLLEKEHEKQYGPRRYGVAREVGISCLLTIALMTLCFLSAIVLRAYWGTIPTP